MRDSNRSRCPQLSIPGPCRVYLLPKAGQTTSCREDSRRSAVQQFHEPMPTGPTILWEDSSMEVTPSYPQILAICSITPTPTWDDSSRKFGLTRCSLKVCLRIYGYCPVTWGRGCSSLIRNGGTRRGSFQGPATLNISPLGGPRCFSGLSCVRVRTVHTSALKRWRKCFSSAAPHGK
jgi:hypothetical protein